MTGLSELHQKWLEKRRISAETAIRYGLYTADRVLVFPFIETSGDKQAIVNRKHRGPNKRFWQDEGGKKTFWNVDVLDDPEVIDGEQPVLITEGEMDALSALEAGYPWAMSIPEGSVDPKTFKGADLEEEAQGRGKFAFMFNNRAKLKGDTRFIVAMDADPAGRLMFEEIVRRIGPGRCLFVEYPRDPVVEDEGETRPCKDLNEVLCHFGAEAVLDVIRAAKPVPVRGLYRLSDYPQIDPVEGLKTGWETLDRHLGLFAGSFTVMTGIPGEGKTTFALNLAVNMARLHGWKTAVFSPEMPTDPHLLDKLRRMVSGLPLYRVRQDETTRRETDAFIDTHFAFIDGEPPGDVLDDDLSIEWVLDRAEDAVHRFGIRLLVIDPWNEVEHARQPGESTTEYTGRAIRMIKRWARRWGVAVIVIAHPTKAVGGDEPRTPNLYDVEGSAHWFNKPDFGVIVLRARDRESGEEIEGVSVIRVSKVRHDTTGMKGDTHMRFDLPSQRFSMLTDNTWRPE